MSRQRVPAAKRKAVQLGIPPELAKRGFDKRAVDAMNVECKRRFGLGIGVIVQELEKAEQILRSVDGPWWRPTPGRRGARAEVALWEGRLREVAAAIAATQLRR